MDNACKIKRRGCLEVICLVRDKRNKAVGNLILKQIQKGLQVQQMLDLNCRVKASQNKVLFENLKLGQLLDLLQLKVLLNVKTVFNLNYENEVEV